MKRKFNVGDTVTVIKRPKTGYFHGGKDIEGFVVEIQSIVTHKEENEPYEVRVNISYGNDEIDGEWMLLESEFEEYYINKELEEVRKMLYEE